MAKACIIRDKDTNAIKKVSAANGRESKLFKQLNSLIGNEDIALLAWARTYSKEFRDWFGNSKAVDENGEPLLLYVDKENTNNKEFKFTIKPNNQPIYLNTTDVEGGSYSATDPEQVKRLLTVVPEVKEINYEVYNSDEYFKDIKIATQDGHNNIIEYKKKQRNIIRNKINDLKGSKNKLETMKVDSKEKKEKFKKYLETIVKLESRLNKTLNEINDDLAELKKDSSLKSLKSVADKDFVKLENLMNKPGVRTASELEEINQIVDFYFNMKIEKDSPHSIYGLNFSISEIYDEITKEEKDLYNDFYLKASEYKNKIDKLEKERVEKIVNSNSRVKNIYDEDFSYEDITKPNKDTNPIDMFLMDATMGIFSSNGLLPQVSLALLEDYQSQELAKSNEQIAEIEDLADKAKDLLDDISSGGFSFRNRKAKDWSIFKQVDEFGNNTGDLIVRYSTKFFNDRAEMFEKFDSLIYKSRMAESEAEQINLREKALEKRKEWYLKNTIQINPGMIPEIIAEFEGNPLFKAETNQAKIDGHILTLKENLGENGYREEVAKQRKLLNNFLKSAQAIKEFSTAEEYNKYVQEFSPFTGIEYANSVGNPFGEILPNMEYNVSIPRKNKASLTIVKQGDANKYIAIDTDVQSNYYDENFSKIDNESDLYNFYRSMMNILKNIKEDFPVELQDKLNVNSIPKFKKAYNEIIIESEGTLDKFSKSSATLMRKLRENFTVGIEDQITYAKKNYITGKTNYEINDSFLSQSKTKIKDIADAEYELFKKEYELSNDLPAGKISLSSCNSAALKVIADNLDMDYADINDIRNRIGEYFSPKTFFKSVAKHRVAQDKSFDLPRVMKMYSELAAKYRARSKSKPLIDLLKSHYEKIKLQSTTDTGKVKYPNQKEENVDEIRENAVRQYRDWYKRVVLNNFSEFKGVDLSDEFMPDNKETTKNFLQKNLAFLTADRKLFKKVLNDEEKKLKKTLEKLIASEKDPIKIKEYNDKIEKLGRSWTTYSILDGFLRAIRIKNLGWNLSSSITNYMEGEAANLIIASQGDYFSEDSYWKARSIVSGALGKFVLRNNIPNANKLKALMNKVDILQDSANELQKSSDVSNFSSALDNLNPMELNRRTEYIIQSPVFISMLLEQTITDNNGENETSVWDAMDENGNLRPPYNTAENISTWEDMNTVKFKDFKSRVSAAINQAHGNYNNLRGMLAKSSAPGKAFVMFKTWLPNALYTRFAVPQDNLLGGVKNFKGRYHSFTGPTSNLFGGIMGFGIGGLTWGLAGIGLGAGWNFVSNKMLNTNSDYVVPRTEMSYIQELLFGTSILLHKTLGMPIKRLFSLVGIDAKMLDSSYLDYKNKISDTFTERDAKNLNANLTELALAVQKLFLMMMAKAMLWDEDEDEEDTKRKMYNLTMNRLSILFDNISQFNVNIHKLAESGTPVIWDTMKQIGGVVTATEEWVNGNDIYTTGVYVGQSKLKVAFNKAFMPGVLKDPLSLGFSSQMEKEFNKAGFTKVMKNMTEKYSAKERNRLKQLKALEKKKMYEEYIKRYEEDDIYLNMEQRKKLKRKIDAFLRKKYPLPPE